MKAAVFTQPNQPFELKQLPDPVPGTGEVVIKVRRCGICGSDINLTSGTPFDFPRDIALGHEYAGEIVAIGTGVSGLKIGDPITAMPRSGCGQCEACQKGFFFHCAEGVSYPGGYAEYARVSADTAYTLPDGVTFSDGALVEPMACGCRAVRHGKIGKSSKTLIIGAGTMGMAATFWARRRGAQDIVVTARSDARKELALTMGASGFITADAALKDNLTAAFKGMPDVVIDCAGASNTIATAIDLVKPSGTVVVLGACCHSAHFVPMVALGKEVNIQFSLAYGRQDFEDTVQVFSAGITTPRAIIQDTISLDQLPERLQQMRHPHAQCKVMVDPWLGTKTVTY